MAVVGFAEPIAQFRLDAQVFEGPVVGPVVILSVERVKSGFNIQ